MTPGAPRLASASRSEPGVRDINEDAVISASLPDGRWLAAVADGMGGLPAGEAASRTALEILRARLEAGSPLVRAVQEANRAVFERSRERPMGSTLVAALFADERVRIANVGDSRAYLLGPVGLVQVTRDHTFAAEATRHGEATAREVAASRWGSSLTRSLGAAETVEVDEFGPLILDDGVRVLLCSDGVHGVLDDDEIEACLEQPSPDEAVDGLVARCLERGARDNLSAVILQWRGGGPAARTRGIVRSGPGVPEAAEKLPGTREPAAAERPDQGGPEAAGRPAGAGPEAAGRPEREGPELVLPVEEERAGEEPGFVLSVEREGPGALAPERWDPGRLARRAPGRRRRKPGRLRSVLLVLALAGVVLLMLAVLW